MPIETGIWRLGKTLERLEPAKMDKEERLEDAITSRLDILDEDLMLVGRQVKTAFGKKIDLLAIRSDGTLVVIENKRDRTPRDVVAQVLDYASWVKGLSYKDVKDIYEQKAKGGLAAGASFEAAFAEAFNAEPPEEVNEAHELVVVATELDASTERIMSYLSDEYGVPVNAVFFRFFRDGEREYLTRTWLRDPQTLAEAGTGKAQKTREPWNGEDFYVAFGEGDHRAWEDGRRYGFVSGGQGRRYSKPLDELFPGARVFVHIPGKGYVGVGKVVERAVRVRDFKVPLDGKMVPILEAPTQAKDMNVNADDPERSEYLVRIDWSKTLPLKEAVWEKGLFANQNITCKLRSSFTIDTLTNRFSIKE